MRYFKNIVESLMYLVVLRAWKEITVTNCAGFSFAFKARKDAHSDSM
jgi:hypothetical protein